MVLSTAVIIKNYFNSDLSKPRNSDCEIGVEIMRFLFDRNYCYYCKNNIILGSTYNEFKYCAMYIILYSVLIMPAVLPLSAEFRTFEVCHPSSTVHLLLRLENSTISLDHNPCRYDLCYRSK